MNVVVWQALHCASLIVTRLALEPLCSVWHITQVVSFKLTGKRVFLMAPIHHHYEKKGWAEPKIIVRFWIIAIMLALVTLAQLKVR